MYASQGNGWPCGDVRFTGGMGSCVGMYASQGNGWPRGDVRFPGEWLDGGIRRINIYIYQLLGWLSVEIEDDILKMERKIGSKRDARTRER